MSAQLSRNDVVFTQRMLKSAGLYAGRIDGIWGKKTDAAVKAFEEKSAAIAEELGRFDQRTERNIETLHLPAQRAARSFMQAVLGAGIEARIISGTRTYAEQNAIFRQGRFGNPGPVVTNARGGQSNHNFGIAWDIGIFAAGAYKPESPLYDKAARAALAAGIANLEWGGDWQRFKDRPHYQLAVDLNLSEIRSRFEQGSAYV